MKRAIAVLLILWSSSVLAQPAAAQAEALFRQARELMAAGKIAEACGAFEESQKLGPAVTTLLNLASCREQNRQFATAWGLFLDAARETRSATDAASRKLHEVAQGRAQKLEPRVSRLTISVPIYSQVDGLEITRGDERVNPGLWNRALPVDAGTHTITARAPGANRWSTQVTVAAERDSKTVEIPDLRNLPRDLGKVDAPAAPIAHQAPPTPREADIADDVRPVKRAPGAALPLAIGAGALALLGGGLGFELWAESKYDTARSEATLQSRRDSLYAAANTRRYVAEACVVTGLAAGGLALWLYLHDRNPEHSSRVGARVDVIPTVAGIALAGQF